jgi:hypothetical protein
MRLDVATIELVAEMLRDYSDDKILFWDTLDGETDVMDAVGRLVMEAVEADHHAAAAKEMSKLYADRASRLQMKRRAVNDAIMTIMDVTGQDKIPHPLATISRRKGRSSVLIIDEKEIPTQLTKTVRTADKTAIKKQLEAGEDVPGAWLDIGLDTVSMRIK